MRKLNLPRVAMGVSLLWCLSAAQALSVNSDGVLWNQFFWQGPKAWSLRPYMEIQERLGQGLSRIEQILFRPAVLFAPTERITLGLGYGWTPTFQVLSSTFASEHRIWQQFAYTAQLSDRFSLTTRTRLEQRWIQSASEVAVRARELIRLQWAIDEDKRWQVVLWDELFWQFNTVTPTSQAGFNQNRILLGPFVRAFENFHIELGYLVVVLRQPDLSDYKISHGVLLGIYTGL